MPSILDYRPATPADSVRTCVRCERTLVVNETNFFHRRRQNGALWIDTRCQECRRTVDRENRRRRAAGNPVRPRRASRVVSGRKFGVEIEYIGAYAALVTQMRSRGLEVEFEGYTHQVRRSWKIVRDASVAGGYELVSPPLSGENGFDQLAKACESLQAAGCTVNGQCGLHVHHEVRDLDAAAFGRLARGWFANQQNTNRLVAASRRNSRWAGPLSEREVRHIESLTSTADTHVRSHFSSFRTERYRSLNVQSYPRYGTVEIRQHQGTLNGKKIAAWVRYGQAIIAAAVAGDVVVGATTHDLLDALDLDAATVTYLKGRADHFAGRVAARA